jgi:outer membrane immunogenic protein
MKKLLLASVAVSALTVGQSGHAADLPLKAPPVPVWSWTGCFIGAQVGWGWQRNKTSQNTFTTNSNGGTVVFFRGAAEGDINSSGGVFGGQVGCDYQFAGGFVVGVQGTFLGTDINTLAQDPLNGVRGTVTPAGLGTPFTFGGGSVGVRTRNVETVTGRFGWAGWSPQTLIYVRGGGAWVDTQLDMRTAAFGGFNVFPAAAIFDTKYSGWTVGGGVEWMIFGNWSAFAEYNFYDFRSKTLLVPPARTPVANGGSNIFGNTVASDATISTVTIGVNYRFNWLSPIIARY